MLDLFKEKCACGSVLKGNTFEENGKKFCCKSCAVLYIDKTKKLKKKSQKGCCR